jgi:cobalamin biosynthesis protein CbiG
LIFFCSGELARYPDSLSSSAALNRFGLHGVCAPAALAAAGPGAELLIPKTAGERVTLAVARAAKKMP